MLKFLPRAFSAACERVRCVPATMVVTWLAALSFIVFLAYALNYSRTRVEQRLTEQMTAIIQLAGDHAELTLDSTDRLMLAALDQMRMLDLDGGEPSGGRRDQLQSLLARHQLRSAGVASLAYADRAGRVAVSSLGVGLGGTTGGQGWYQGMGASRGERPLVTAAVQDPVSMAWGLQLARRIEPPNGPPVGTLVATLTLDDGLSRLFAPVDEQDRDTLALVDRHGRILISQPHRPHSGEADSVDAAILADIVAGDPVGVRYSRAEGDEPRRLLAYRRLSGYPLYVVYGKEMGEVVAAWRYESGVVILAAVLAVLLSAIVTFGIHRRVALTDQLQEMRRRLEESNDALRAALAATELVAARDPLTGLWNRRAFDQRMDEQIARLCRHEGTFSLLLIDLDHFKSVNDVHGHMVGDQVLRHFADQLGGRLRQNDVAARWGGEEFAVLADGADLRRALALAEDIRQATGSMAFPAGLQLSVSVGVAEYRRGESHGELLAHADEALYQAKRGGRNRVVAAPRDASGHLFAHESSPEPLLAEAAGR